MIDFSTASLKCAVKDPGKFWSLFQPQKQNLQESLVNSSK